MYNVKTKLDNQAGDYDIYPSFKLNDNEIINGFESLANLISKHRVVIIDGYVGVFYDNFQENLSILLKDKGLSISWINTSDYFKEKSIVSEITAPFLGGDDPVFGKRTTLSLGDFYDLSSLKNITPGKDSDISIIIGPGAALAGWKGFMIYLDVPKNEIQFRSRAGSITNLGAAPSGSKEMYKRFYFVDWIVLNRHKKDLLPEIDVIVDTRNPECPEWMTGEVFRKALSELSHQAFRVRPWFEPGIWGGTWIKDHIKGLKKDVPNYAWSFELITPENGLLFESSGRLLEVSFDFLMFSEGENILGECYERYGTEFPIRFDFLDTFDGDNLSIQCHPQPDYMKTRFGEKFTQEETYYILDTKDNAVVYLGFQEDISKEKFAQELVESQLKSEPIEIGKFVQKHQATKHDLFLIPYGTIHGSGKNNLVLEISSTPYIFTFKLYDWLRMDMDGKPRPINIKRGMENLNFERKGAYIKDNLISKPVLLNGGEGWQSFHLPTHEDHLYDVHRHHFKKSIEFSTGKKCHVMNLVEGKSIVVETSKGQSHRFNYAETFVIPAAAGKYKIINESDCDAIIVDAFVK